MGRSAFKRLMVAAPVLAALLAAPAFAAVEVETTGIGHGVKVWYAPSSAAPVVDVRISFEGAGSISDPEGKGGRAAFAASLLTEGAGNLDSAAFRRALEDKAITLTAETDEDRLNIHIYTLREHAAYAGEMLALALRKPLLAEPDQARMKADITSLLHRLEERPSYKASRMLSGRGFKDHPYSNAPYGTAESIARLNTQDVLDYLRTYVTRGNVFVAASGDVDASLLDDMLEPVIDALSENDSGAVAVAQTNLQGAGETLTAEVPTPQTAVLFAAPAIARDDKRFYAQYLLNHILGGSALFSRLGDQVRQKKGLVYSIDTDLDMKRGAAVLAGALSTRNANAPAALAEVKSVLSELHTKGATTEECNDAKGYVLGSFARRLDSTGEVTSMLLSMQVHKLGEDYLEKREGLFKAVSCSDINAVAADLLNPANFLFVTVGGKAEGQAAPIAQESSASHRDVK